MITQPSCSRLLAVVRAELQSTVAPAISDASVLAALGMIDSILANVGARCDHEVAWMREEIAEIEMVADQLLAAGADTGSKVAAALNELRTGRSPSDYTADVRTEYDLAGEVLSRALEAALPRRDDLSNRVRSVLEHRLHREVEIRGDFTLVGR
ncbi:hypothetical protein BOO86_15100 [Mycobacterium sp. CBMA 234]|uniref:hypothetical protein n=1 Tax=Mycolicibacterium sp. CBMA 234 TaxID=1918495 RepID=UPI0012DD26FA|nr:hypothetical protein [Mycolicibacterium sp. CBMA 234]MUL65801.1 hypothetical protein [Mycolicibacterium sp. CBMA 234]